MSKSWIDETKIHPSHRLGLFVIILIPSIIFIVGHLSPKESHKEQDNFKLEDVYLQEELLTSKVQPKKNPPKELPLTKSKKKEEETLKFRFDPNTINEDSLLLLGFEKRVAKNWISFREKGKVYKSVEDVKSIYGIEPAQAESLREFMIFPRRLATVDIKEIEKLTEQRMDPIPLGIKKIDLNNCTDEDLKSIKGIGPAFASRILKYRELLGGFSHAKQLKQVYGLTDSTFQLIRPFVEIQTPPQKIMINQLEKSELSKHFMVSYKEAKLITAYRREHGPFKDSTDFKNLLGLEKQGRNELIPYLDFTL